MPTSPRKQCESEIYHVIQRGTGQLDIFEDDRDRAVLASLLAENMAKRGVAVYAWCFMSNHVHLLVRGSISKISDAMRAACALYARKFNNRHQRSGALFQGRFTSVPVATDAQFLTVVRYVHMNPVSAGLCNTCGDWAWSSFSQYVNDPAVLRGKVPALHVEGDFVLDMVSGVDSFRRLHDTTDAHIALDVRACDVQSEDDARELATCVLAGVSVDTVGKRPREERDDMIRLLKRSGFGIRLIQRLTGINYSAIRNA